MSNLSFTIDTEVFPNCFLLVARIIDTKITFVFEISDYKNQSAELHSFLSWMRNNQCRAYGYNMVNFDGPLIHTFMQTGGTASAKLLFEKAQAIINSEDRFAYQVYPSDREFPWVCLMKINHFDNHARSTSLKVLEFNMRMDSICDLPFTVGSTLTPEQIELLKTYCIHDVEATELFRQKCIGAIEFRETLSAKYGKDFMNHSDVKIGKEIFQIELEKVGVQCYKGREPKQTIRSSIRLSECIPSWIKFKNPEFNRIKHWLTEQVITETKGVFNDLTAQAGGLTFVFGTGGIHASVEKQRYVANDEYMILDIDVQSLYPSIAIANNYYPEHLGKQFVEVYARLKEQRIGFKKGTVENAAYKLALNGVYGASNDKFSVFYDPKFTMDITIGGQLMLAMLAEKLIEIDNVKILSCNTDGITMYLPRSIKWLVDAVCAEWEQITKLHLEQVEYSKMFIQNVNNYIADAKRKGCYEYNLEWHQNHSALVVPKVAEQVLLYGKPIRETVEQWPDKHDFMLRTKVPRNSYLTIDSDRIQNITRYYVARGGKQLFKWMPPLKGKTEWRRIGIVAGWGVQVCNDIHDTVLPIDYDYYIQEVKKLTTGMI